MRVVDWGVRVIDKGDNVLERDNSEDLIIFVLWNALPYEVQVLFHHLVVQEPGLLLGDSLLQKEGGLESVALINSVLSVFRVIGG